MQAAGEFFIDVVHMLRVYRLRGLDLTSYEGFSAGFVLRLPARTELFSSFVFEKN